MKDYYLFPYKILITKNKDQYLFNLDEERLMYFQKNFGGKIRKYKNRIKAICYKDRKNNLTYWLSNENLSAEPVEGSIEAFFSVISISKIDNNKVCDIPKKPMDVSFFINIDKKNRIPEYDYDKIVFPSIGNTFDDIKTYFKNKNLKLSENNTISFRSDMVFSDNKIKSDAFMDQSFVLYVLKDNKIVGLSIGKFTSY